MWLFPWSVYFPAVAKLSFRPVDRAGQDALAGAVLDRIPAGVLHFFDHAGILFDAVLSGAGAAARLGHGGGRRLGAAGDAGAVGDSGVCAAVACFALLFVVRGLPTPGDISTALSAASRRVHAFARPYGGPHASVVRVSAAAACSWPAIAFLVGALGTMRATGQRAFLAAAVMVVLFFHAARWRWWCSILTCRRGRWRKRLLQAPDGQADRRSSLLHVFLDFFLHQPDCAAAERADQQSGLRFLRAGRSGRFHRRPAMEAACGWAEQRCYMVANDPERAALRKAGGRGAT